MPAATIVLTGFMGTGKSTVGRLLAERLDVPLVDTDTLIEQRHGPIADIFANHGAEHFRDLEHDIACELSNTSGVISTGGKFMLDPRNAAEFVDAHVFCLTASVDTIVRRVTHSDDISKRPLLAGDDVADRVVRLLAERASAYGAFAQVDTEGKTPATVVDEICARLSSDHRVTAARKGAMSSFTQGNATIHYDLEGQPDGFPVLLIALGGMHSANEVWERSPWNPRTQLADTYRIVGMDQRNAGRSSAPVTADDNWTTYTRDQVALLDHLEIERCHVIGMCIGGPYIMNLLQHAPDRVASAVMLQPVGIEPDGSNRDLMYNMYDEWAAQLPAERVTSDDALAGLRANMWDGDFVLTADESTVVATETPMLIARGDDPYHPACTSERIAELAPAATLVHSWKSGDDLAAFNQQARDFLAGHTS